MPNHELSNQHDRNTNKLPDGKAWLLICASVAFLAALTRFLWLADKPYHHDESLHGYYSQRVALGNPHEYSALLHGPVLYYLVGAFMAVFGTSDFTARFPAALCSVALVCLPFLWARTIGKIAALSIALFLLASPTFMYFGRFLREDAFNSLWIACSLSGFFAYHFWGKPWQANMAAAFLAMQFCNKENSYLHVFVWLTGIGFVLWMMKRDGLRNADDLRGGRQVLSPVSERVALLVNCISIFVVIFILFYSSFFRHSKGALHGVLDGLYRESLLYWWDQNQKRRIDGPFDYHFPLLFNYEFALIPAVIAAWVRSVRGAVQISARAAVRFPLTLFRNGKRLAALSIVLLAAIALPRIGLTAEGCGISEYCASSLLGEGASTRLSGFAKVLHIAHTRHLMQIVAIALLGALAVFANVRLRRFVDGFFWWWATGMLGIYSYVGEKVPWLLIYILLPLVVLAGLELGRLFSRADPPAPVLDSQTDSTLADLQRQSDLQFSLRANRWVLSLTLVFAAFASWKAIRLSFLEPASPQERLVFTQTTPSMKAVRTRWEELREEKNQQPKVTMFGDSTWPMAWYGHDIPNIEFIKPADAAAAQTYDAIFLDLGDLDFARTQLQSFDIYRVPLRHWWVPQANPTAREIFEYFLTSRPYPRELRHSPPEQGVGDTAILYLENKLPGRFFAETAACACGEKIEEAKNPIQAPADSPLMSPDIPVERKN